MGPIPSSRALMSSALWQRFHLLTLINSDSSQQVWCCCPRSVEGLDCKLLRQIDVQKSKKGPFQLFKVCSVFKTTAELLCCLQFVSQSWQSPQRFRCVLGGVCVLFQVTELCMKPVYRGLKTYVFLISVLFKLHKFWVYLIFDSVSYPCRKMLQCLLKLKMLCQYWGNPGRFRTKYIYPLAATLK